MARPCSEVRQALERVMDRNVQTLSESTTLLGLLAIDRPDGLEAGKRLFEAVRDVTNRVHSLEATLRIGASRVLGLPGLSFYRARLGWTQTDLARRLGVRKQQVWRWEHGERDCADWMKKRIIAVLAEDGVAVTEADLLNSPAQEVSP